MNLSGTRVFLVALNEISTNVSFKLDRVGQIKHNILLDFHSDDDYSHPFKHSDFINKCNGLSLQI